ncbi:MAG: 1-deoxy-D-xylulose-5-phosphate reductoisomerase [Polaromonas sp. 39-63-203]|jgi:1-deoxy-D-xylulose-5-phosphate reductoisomerase|uniref:1-deoxy-D-xylulose-5-phosphate reductoisomerase n=1 Tax=Polaromonas sp. TaxID=1869339 RepID=UPI000BD5B6A9|nr:1-deoxy-D-xylulose-5-phosphate reductoisomerase [Polaromonas sp.]OYY49270.1 MAG: 1-deoxy-D-xylulose-5-phosphate reductoisomerase [Polaromonas sp. 35-63-240]OYZ81601.1 MAG: 1-deoxy-D-xylulose-5-phosphate reductoisomerase [Polaromonas sp. 24-62-144]OZA95506.1 MAG: 1-deoxy-D-xylulose-5-phosphate reductoisomerase [Polaromonas sp. 39-63-203]HQS32606.1 1-deoxy-D-xylulose-5-phosphate reductoisomerase [Polaromonas sp.]HQS92134.1 1-deoxy-D-xylulose-5-phosphate reductoisomerase [Polaromonas sp.]
MSLPKQRVTVLGSTGSVGVNTLDVIARHPERFEVFALSAATQVDLMLAQCAAFKPRYAVMVSPVHARALTEKLKQNQLQVQVLSAPDALEMIASHEQVDTVMAAIVGAAGLGACMAAASAGKRLLLANKEALVVGGEVFMQAVRTGGARLLPIDSEHSAIFQSLPEDSATWAQRVEKIILTASGGPFRTRAPGTLRDVTPDEACAHPNWVMGRKISVDSATMMNKALEVVEAKFLFGLAPQQIEVVIHPQSIIHSMVQYRDTSVVAQLGTPDMRVPIAFGLAWPDRVASGARSLDFTALSDMTFEAPDDKRFPGLRLAWQVLDAVTGSPAVLNAANEVAVAAFLEKRIRFDDIHRVNHATLDTVSVSQVNDIEGLIALDAQSRQIATRIAERLES